jgi:hypothetical protein
MRTTSQANTLRRLGHHRHEKSAGQLVQINSTIIQPFLYAHFQHGALHYDALLLTWRRTFLYECFDLVQCSHFYIFNRMRNLFPGAPEDSREGSGDGCGFVLVPLYVMKADGVEGTLQHGSATYSMFYYIGYMNFITYDNWNELIDIIDII